MKTELQNGNVAHKGCYEAKIANEERRIEEERRRKIEEKQKAQKEYEKQQIAKGSVKYKGKWMTPEEKYAKQGLVLYKGDWVKRIKMEDAELKELTKKLKYPPKKNPNRTYIDLDIDYAMKKGLYNQAINQIDHELSSGYYSEPSNRWRLRGLCYQKLDDYEEAIKNYDISIFYQMSGMDYMSKLDMIIDMAICYSKIGKFDDAMKFLNKVKEKEPKYQRLLEVTELINSEKTKSRFKKEVKDINIERLTPKEFEELIASLFEKMGYEAHTTKASGDFGCDIIAKNNEETIVIQAKKHKKKVNLKAVQEIVGARNHFSANKAIVITTSDFLKSAKDLAKSNNVELWNGDKLREAILMR